MIQLIDAHVHFDDPRFDSDRNEVYARACRAGIMGMIVPSTTAGDWSRTRQCAETYRNVYPAYGLHPYFIDQHQPAHLDTLEAWIQKERPVAVGECGLDYFLDDLDRDKQRVFFRDQLRIAKAFDLPIIIHARKAVEEVICLIKQSGHRKGMIHSYNGSLQQAEQLIELGYFLSFGGAVTWSRARKLRTLVATLPLEHLLLETDAPDQPGANHLGQRNEPAYLLEVLDTFAELRSEDKSTIAEQARQNTVELFRLERGKSG